MNQSQQMSTSTLQELEVHGTRKLKSDKSPRKNQRDLSSDNKSRVSGISGDYTRTRSQQKKDLLNEFIKQTLQKTRIEEGQVMVGRSAVPKYVPKEKRDSQSLEKGQPQDAKDYKNVKSRVRE